MSMTPLQRGTVMDPSRIYFLNEYYLIENLTVRLVEMDAQVGYKLMLASSIEEKSELDYEIKIRKTAFSNGEIINVEDVRDSLLRATGNKNSHIPFGDIVEKITSENDTVKIKLKKRVNDFMYFLTLADLSILHKSQFTKSELLVEDWERVSSGPYTYKIQGADVYLEENPYYELSARNYPKKIKVVTSRERDTYKDFKKELIDFGEFNLNSYEKHLSDLKDAKNLQVIGNSGDMINFFALNVDNPKFKKEYNRRWIQKKILLNYKLDKKYDMIARKAVQFFTPLVKGFLTEGKVIDEVESWKDIDISKIPEELKSGITISTYQRAFEVTLKGAFDSLESVLGIPVRVEADVPSPDFETFINKREFEVFLGITAMDQIIVGESINLYYFSFSPMFKDVNKKIRKLMDRYQHSDPSKTLEVVNEVALQMIQDAECIPLFYVASPFFYNSNKLDVSGLDEMTYFNLWKIKVL